VLVKRKGGRREAASEGSVEQNRDLTNRNRIRGSLGWTSGSLTAKSISTKSHGCKSGRCAGKAVELTPGDLRSRPCRDWASREASRSRSRSQQTA
jgi:hypothetical protein